jgi:PHD/YefM family antitoxin component YafN of YafNO toxin-antitoxin module
MTITTLSGEELDQDPSRAQKAANNGPVFIVEGGRNAYVLLSIDEYRRITNNPESIVDLLATPEAAEIEFDPPRLGDQPVRPADFS